MTDSDRIKEVQGKYHLNQSELAGLLNIDQSTVSKYISGQREMAGNVVWTFIDRFYYKLRPRRKVKCTKIH